MQIHRLTLAALLFAASPAFADTLIDNANGVQVGANGKLQRFTGIVIGDDGKVKVVLAKGQKRPLRIARRIDAGGKTMLPGLIDAHVLQFRLYLLAYFYSVLGATTLVGIESHPF